LKKLSKLALDRIRWNSKSKRAFELVLECVWTSKKPSKLVRMVGFEVRKPCAR
jgi:hypothetical protein